MNKENKILRSVLYETLQNNYLSQEYRHKKGSLN